MAECKVNSTGLSSAVNHIGGPEQGKLMGIAKKYETAGIALINALDAAIANMEGQTKDALQQFFDTEVKRFVVTDLPAAINGLSALLEANRVNFVEVDKQIAESISEGTAQ